MRILKRLLNQKIIPLSNQILLIFFTIILKPFFFLNKKSILFVTDRPFGVDNGIYMFKKLRQNKSYKTVYLCKNKKDAIFKNLLGEKNTIYYYSFRHLWYFIHSDMILFSYDTAPFYFNSSGIYFKKLLKPKTKLVFLQHGVIDSEIPTFMKSNTYFNIFITSSIQEFNSIKSWSGYNEELKVTGLPRFDGLLKQKTHKSKKILFMPTWDQKLLNMSYGEFKDSLYYKKVHAVLSSKKIKSFLEENNISLIYCIHKQLNKYLHLFKDCENANIKIVGSFDNNGVNVHKLIQTSSCIITDYSSVSFDFGYSKKPVLYYHFQKYQYNTTGFNYEQQGFGPIVNSNKGILCNLDLFLNSNFELDQKYIKRVQKYFKFIDSTNTERVINEILK